MDLKNGHSRGTYSAPVVVDMNKDGRPEIVIGGFDGKIWVFKADATVLEGFPVSLVSPKSDMPARIMATPTVADLNGDGIADSRFRPNDLMDHVLWSQPAAALLTGSPVVQLVRYSQSSFPATLPGGVVDSFPLMAPPAIALSPEIETAAAAAKAARAAQGQDDEQLDPLTAH